MRGALPDQPVAVLKHIAKTYQNATVEEITRVLETIITEEAKETQAQLQPTSRGDATENDGQRVVTDGPGTTVSVAGPRHQIFHRGISDSFDPSDPVDTHIR